MNFRLLKIFLVACLLFLGIKTTQAATYDWIGTTSSNWTITSNWQQGIVPLSTDNVRIGVKYDFTSQPNIPASTAVTVASLTFGCNYTSFSQITLTIKAGSSLTITNDITMQADAYSAAASPNTVNLTGTGTLQAKNLNIISNYTAASAYTQTVNASVTSLILTGNIALTSSDNGTYTYNSAFTETAGVDNVTGTLTSTNTTNATSSFTVNGSAAATATLQLANATAFSGLSATGTNSLSFNNTYSTIEYCGASQTVYSDAVVTGLAGGPRYYSLKFSGTGIKTTNAGNMYVYGDFTNTLTNDASNYTALTTSIFRFIGTNNQNLYAGAGNGVTFTKVYFNAGSTKYLVSGNFYVSSGGTLLMNGSSASTILYTNGLLTLLSDAGSTATVGNNNTEPTIIGNINVQRFVTGGSGYRGYRLFASPVNISSLASEATTTGYIGLSYLNSGILTAGPGSGFSVYNANPLIYLYDESRTTNNTSYTSGKDVGITSITGATGSPAYSVTTLGATTTSGVTIPVGNAFMLYYVGSTASTVINSSRVADNATTTAVGYVNQGNIPVTFWNYTNTGTTSMPYHTGTGAILSGVNLLGNPYPSTISLLQIYTDNSASITPTFYELNAPGQSYISYNGQDSTRSSARASRYIVSGQGFLAIASGTGKTFTFYEDQKVAYPNMTTTTTTKAQGGTLLMNFPVAKTSLADGTVSTSTQKMAMPVVQSDFIEATNKTLSGLHLQLSKDSLTYEQTGIYFASNRSDAYNVNEDAMDIGGPNPQVLISSFSSDGTRLTINELGSYLKGKRVKLFVKAVTDGLYALSLADIQNIDTTLFNVYLIDNYKKDSLDIVQKKGYAFSMTAADTSSFGANRFVLAIRLKSLPLYKLLSFLGQKIISGVQLNWKVINEGNYTGFTLQKMNKIGDYDSLYAIQSDSAANYTFIDQHPTLGDNVYRLAQNDITGNITYSAPVTIGYNNTLGNGLLTIYPNPAKDIININLNTNTINTPTYESDIYNASGTLIKHENINGTTWTDDVSSYKLGIYIIQIKDNNGNIIGRAKFSKVN